MDHVLK
jgi:hypothetical protein